MCRRDSIWGPESPGHAPIHLWCVTFDMDFGATTTPKLEPVDWATFNSSFLPPDKTKMAQISVMAGLLPVSYTHLRAHETVLDLLCRLLLETKTY